MITNRLRKMRQSTAALLNSALGDNMSERGSFVTEFIYCQECLKAAMSVLLSKDKYLMATLIPHWNGGEVPLPVIAGKVGGLSPGEELITFEHDLIPKLERSICHKMRIAVLAESGEKIFNISPNT